MHREFEQNPTAWNHILYSDRAVAPIFREANAITYWTIKEKAPAVAVNGSATTYFVHVLYNFHTQNAKFQSPNSLPTKILQSGDSVASHVKNNKNNM